MGGDGGVNISLSVCCEQSLSDVVLLIYVHGKQLWSCENGRFILGRVRFSKRLNSTQCPYLRQ